MNRLIPLSLVVVALAIFFLYINPAYTGGIAASRAEIASDNQSLAALASYSAKENQLLASKNQISSANLALIAELLPASVNNVQTILDLDNLAAASGLELSSVDVANDSASGGGSSGSGSDVQGVPTSQDVGSVDLSLSAAGSYRSFRTFLAGVEDSARLLDVESIGVKGSATGVYTYNLTLRLYWLQ